jgi:hypothetical protein
VKGSLAGRSNEHEREQGSEWLSQEERGGLAESVLGGGLFRLSFSSAQFSQYISGTVWPVQVLFGRQRLLL